MSTTKKQRQAELEAAGYVFDIRPECWRVTFNNRWIGNGGTFGDAPKLNLNSAIQCAEQHAAKMAPRQPGEA